MPRYFLELAYKGTKYSGFQRQENANTVQAEVEKAFHILHRKPVSLTGSSRTDAGVHALQNYFHFDYEKLHAQFLYKMNAILPGDIVLKKIQVMHAEAHCRFDAISRKYHYNIYQAKNPFLIEEAFFYPFKIDLVLMQEAAAMVKSKSNFFAFCKANSQVKNFNCTIYQSEWVKEEDRLVYKIEANRFLRGMVRLLTASLLQIGRRKVSLEEFEELFESKTKCGFAVPPQGLFLRAVNFPSNYFGL